jgi:hypothetical protein
MELLVVSFLFHRGNVKSYDLANLNRPNLLKIYWNTNVFQHDWYIKKQMLHNANFSFVCGLFLPWETLHKHRKLHPVEYIKHVFVHPHIDISNLYTGYLISCGMSHQNPQWGLTTSYPIAENFPSITWQ